MQGCVPPPPRTAHRSRGSRASGYLHAERPASWFLCLNSAPGNTCPRDLHNPAGQATPPYSPRLQVGSLLPHQGEGVPLECSEDRLLPRSPFRMLGPPRQAPDLGSLFRPPHQELQAQGVGSPPASQPRRRGQHVALSSLSLGCGPFPHTRLCDPEHERCALCLLPHSCCTTPLPAHPRLLHLPSLNRGPFSPHPWVQSRERLRTARMEAEWPGAWKQWEGGPG